MDLNSLLGVAQDGCANMQNIALLEAMRTAFIVSIALAILILVLAGQRYLSSKMPVVRMINTNPLAAAIYHGLVILGLCFAYVGIWYCAVRVI